ncbi:GNAT family N-acetyltransferase [bacterium SCSIO 12643]|nr:GNAT family N-acetyltransferase [bacterium SCSIO 12643]
MKNLNLIKHIHTSVSFESERLKTSILYEDDIEALFQMYSDHEAMKYRGSQPMTSISEAHTMVANPISEKGSISKLRLGIRTQSSNILIGTLLLSYNYDLENQLEIGFSFGKKFWNQGYGTETLQMVISQLQTLKQMKELKAWCIKENLASIRIFENAGFSKMAQNEYPQSHLFVKQL